ncbi:MAG: 2-oxoacid:acceptor oxidoreductase family protein [Lachnospiraceae bacterium]|nr:2-oxoacid:acceptor oxidoreductase family protein [Lachnospiraceae bacterium]
MKILEKILFAGFGGQGILSIGKILADTCVENQLNASWLPSYGPEMRGGTCNCLVVTSNERILSPYFERPTNAIIMNQASLNRFCEKLQTSKVVVLDSSLASLSEEQEELLKDVHVIQVDANEIAAKLGSTKCANMVMLGAYAKQSTALNLDTLKESVARKFAKKPALVEMDLKALEQGYGMA